MPYGTKAEDLRLVAEACERVIYESCTNMGWNCFESQIKFIYSSWQMYKDIRIGHDKIGHDDPCPIFEEKRKYLQA